jgi:hypothetical protein
LRGLKGNSLDPQDIYRSKKELVLSSLYGVDINPIAVEIAKLRIWLKMVEDGWKEDYGQLPNININIVDGNSLIGLPVIGDGQVMLKKFQSDLSQIQDVRERYKKGEINRNELSKNIALLKTQLSDNFLLSSTHYFKEKVTDYNVLKRILDSVDHTFPTIKEVKVERQDSCTFSQLDLLELKNLGFECNSSIGTLKGSILNKKGGRPTNSP